MFLKILLNYLFGYVNICVESYFLERFINICISKKILLWNIKRNKSTTMYANISIGDYKKLKQICRKTKSKVRIETKKGFPFILHKHRKRKIFFVLLIIVGLILIVMSNFIWNIEVKGNVNISSMEIFQSLEEQGLKVGVSKSKIDINKIVNNIRLNNDNVAWIGINLKGTNATITIQEATKAPEIINENEYCNIISNKTGVIIKMNVQNGTVMVKEGDIVKEGDLLISGYMEGKYTGTRYVHAQADIKAKIWYSKKEKVYLNQEIEKSTGATEQKYSLNINNFYINFYKTLSKFQNYDTIRESKKVILFSNFYLPIELVKTTNYEKTKQDITYTEKEAIENITKKIEQELKNNIENKENIVNKQINTYGNEGYVEVEVIYEVLENIGSKDRIIF